MAGIKTEKKWKWRGFKSGLFLVTTISLDNREARNPTLVKRTLQALAFAQTGAMVGAILAWLIESKCDEIAEKNRGRGVRVVITMKAWPMVPGDWNVDIEPR